jgi:SAM-dependent methyltransferase
MAFTNCYDDDAKAASYATLEFANTYYLAFRDLPSIFAEHVHGTRALDFGCGTGRSTRFVRGCGFQVTGVDVAPRMIAKATELDPGGDYRLAADDDLSTFEAGHYDVVLSAFTFDNIPGWDTKVRLFGDLARLLNSTGKIVSIVSDPQIYTHEWASFSTADYPENRNAQTGDVVRIITTDFADRRPAEDILWTEESYGEVYRRAGLAVVAQYKPLAAGNEPYQWVNETRLAPWVIYVLAKESTGP